MKEGEIVVYQPNETEFHLDVRIDDETVWLTQAQMVELFASTKQNISLHINNIFKEGELRQSTTVKEYLTVQQEGLRSVRRKVFHYNLDVIISVGYRVKSLRGTQFRIWANAILKEYLLKGHAIHQRIDRIEKKITEHDKQFDLLIHSSLPPNEGIFYEGQIYDAWQFVTNIIKHATTSIILIDNYIDDTVLTLLSKRNKEVTAIIYTANISKQLKTDLDKFNAQFKPIDIRVYNQSHDRFLIIDNYTVYHIGASIKDLGKKWFAFSKIRIDASEMIQKLENKTTGSD